VTEHHRFPDIHKDTNTHIKIETNLIQAVHRNEASETWPPGRTKELSTLNLYYIGGIFPYDKESVLETIKYRRYYDYKFKK